MQRLRMYGIMPQEYKVMRVYHFVQGRRGGGGAASGRYPAVMGYSPMLGINNGCPSQSPPCSGRSQKEPKELSTLYPEPSARVSGSPVIFRTLSALADSQK